MIIIGEKINATRKAVAAAIEARDAEAIARTAAEQLSAGADYLDLNGGDPRPEVEVENVKWLVEVVQGRADAPLCIDSANPRAIEAGLSAAAGKCVVNSISLEATRREGLLPIVADHECMVIALCMSDEGMPAGADDRVDRAGRLIEMLTEAGKKPDEIIVDPCFVPVSADPASGRRVCEAIARIRREFPGVHVGGGLSNVSFGLPERKLINRAALAAAIHAGMDVALIDPTAGMMLPLILAAEVFAGADEWCANYVAAYRQGKLK